MSCTGENQKYDSFKFICERLNYRLSIVNLMKPDSLYSNGMRPLFYSQKKAELKKVGWHRAGDNITYYKNDLQ
jgi:cytosolic carboxypeptidase protein 2/3